MDPDPDYEEIAWVSAPTYDMMVGAKRELVEPCIGVQMQVVGCVNHVEPGGTHRLFASSTISSEVDATSNFSKRA